MALIAIDFPTTARRDIVGDVAESKAPRRLAAEYITGQGGDDGV